MRASIQRGLIALPVVLIVAATAFWIAWSPHLFFARVFAGKPWIAVTPFWALLVCVGVMCAFVTTALAIFAIDVTEERDPGLRWWIRIPLALVASFLGGVFGSPLALAILIEG